MKTQRFPHDSTVLPGKLPLALLVAQACCLPALAAPADSKSGGEQTLAPVVVYAMPGGRRWSAVRPVICAACLTTLPA